MRIAVVSEAGTRDKNGRIIQALKEVTGAQVLNLGMSETGDEPQLNCIHTGLIAALALYVGAADFVVGGCETGQRFLISAMQYPGVFCGLIDNPHDAGLFSQINAGNCVSLPLNQAELPLRDIFGKLFCGKAQQSANRQAEHDALARLGKVTKRSIPEIVPALDPAIISRVMNHRAFLALIGGA